MGVELTGYQCYELKPGPLFDSYREGDLHYAIDAVQKGLKPPTRVGLKRMKKRNMKKKQKRKDQMERQEGYVQELNPQSAEQVCMKALRRQFKEQIAPTPEKVDH
jgi:hypothetical protein